MKATVNPDNGTEVFFSFDGREPSLDDHDFGADFSYFPQDEDKVIEAVKKIAVLINQETK